MFIKTILMAAMAAGALAFPHVKRDLVTATDYDVVYVTDVVTVYASAAAASSSPSVQASAHYGHSYHGSYSSAVASSSQAPASTYQAPSWTSTPVYVAPTTSTSAAPASTAAASSSVAAAAAVPSTYQEFTTYHHNIHRANHSAPNIAWSDSLASSAATIAASCVYAHNINVDGGGYGQNIAAGVQGDNISAIITDLFYNGEVGYYTDLYGQAQPDMTNFEHWGHFSQIVWKDTTTVGCATQDCTSQGLANTGSDVSPYFTVCNYGPPGNYANEYGSNIGSPIGEPTSQWNAGGFS